MSLYTVKSSLIAQSNTSCISVPFQFNQLQLHTVLISKIPSLSTVTSSTVHVPRLDWGASHAAWRHIVNENVSKAAARLIVSYHEQ